MNAIPSRPIVADAANRGEARSASRSHVGLIRAINEDRVFDCPEAGLWAVADGMGGHRGGDLAAQAVIDELRRLTQTADRITAADVLAALIAANAAILRRNRESGFDAGATVVVALLTGETAHIAWAGDSRAYRLHGGGTDLLTQDHSVVQELVAAGLLSAEMAERHPQANVVTRALGVGDDVELDWVSVELRRGDRLLLCSDGLSRSLRDHGGAPPSTVQDAADALLADALRRDGSDNISLVIVEPSGP